MKLARTGMHIGWRGAMPRRGWAPGAGVVLLAAALAGTAHAGKTPARPVSDASLGSAVRQHAFTTLDGKPLSLASLKGEVVVVNFWASWCGPCRKELPALDDLNTENRAARWPCDRGLHRPRALQRGALRPQAGPDAADPARRAGRFGEGARPAAHPVHAGARPQRRGRVHHQRRRRRVGGGDRRRHAPADRQGRSGVADRGGDAR